MKTRPILAWGMLVAMSFSCGKLARPGKPSPVSPPDVSEPGASGMSSGGEGAQSDAAGAGGTAERGGASSDGGAPSGGQTGGVAAGRAGASSGAGNSRAGAAAAGANAVAPPEGCESESEHVGGLYCSTEVTCAGALLVVSCTADTTGLWSCTCTNRGSITSYDVPGVTGGPTCEVVAQACATPALPSGEEMCTLTQLKDLELCSLEVTCKHVILIDGAEHVEQKSVATPSCKPCSEAASWCCTCGDNNLPDYRIRASDLSDGCEFLGELCKAAPPPRAGPVTCAPTFDDAIGAYGCHTGARCDRQLELADGSRITLSQAYDAHCQELDGRARCTCADEANVKRLALGFSLPVSGLKDCHTTLGACAGALELVVQGAPNCTSTDEASPSSCRRILDCAEAALVGDGEVTVQTRIDTSCDRQSDGSWRCTCVNGIPFSESTVLTLEAVDSRAACGQASETCPPAVSYQ